MNHKQWPGGVHPLRRNGPPVRHARGGYRGVRSETDRPCYRGVRGGVGVAKADGGEGEGTVPHPAGWFVPSPFFHTIELVE